MQSQQIWEQDVQETAGGGRLAILCGAGISSALSGNAAESTWTGLLVNGLEFLGSMQDESAREEATLIGAMLKKSPSTQMLVACAEWVKLHFSKFPPGEYKAWLDRTVGKLQLKPGKLDPSFAADMPLLTTNYDLLLEELTGRQPVTWTDDSMIEDFDKSPQDFVFHLHGYYKAPNSVILSGGDYSRLLDAKSTARVLELLSGSRTYLLAGYGAGLSDPNFEQFFKWFRGNFEAWTKRIYVLVREGDLPTPSLQEKLAYLSYGQQYDDLPPYLNRLLNGKHKADKGKPPASLASVAEHAREGEPVDLDNLLPPPVMTEVTSKIGALSDLTDFQWSVLRVAQKAMTERGSALISAVTGSGKTTMARVGMNLAIGAGASTMMLLPTKALVAQEVAEWEKDWVAAWEAADRHIRVYGSSRDYPEHDSPVSKGRFEVAVAIYEKLSAYLVSGQNPLVKTRLLVVDELQTLVEDRERATKLEGLLTMVRLTPTNERPAILGLSATLSQESTGLLREWLGVNQFSFVQTSVRPVPLDTFVMDRASVKKQADAHLLALGESRISIPAPVEYGHEITKDMQPAELARLEVKNLSTGSLAAALTADFLKSDNERRILVFVPGRTVAQDLALAIQTLLIKQLGKPQRKGSPWSAGRFRNATLDPMIANAWFGALEHSDLPMTDEVIRGLRHGVAFHSARLPAGHRRLLEQEFRDPNGILRVLVATDTLAIGVNLTADTVIATSISGYSSGGTRRLLTAAELDNKGGRAGRRGHMRRERGEFYILVPDQRDLQNVIDITVEETRTLSDIDGVFDRYVRSKVRTPSISGRITELDDVARLVLQVLCADGFGRAGQALEKRVEAVVKSLLAAQDPEARLPSATEVIQRLLELQLVAESGSKVRPSRLGTALGRSGLSLVNASVLERLARLAVVGAGDIDLLYNAFRSGEMEDVTAWVALPNVPARHYPSLRERVITYAMAYCAGTFDQRNDCTRLLGVERHPLPEKLVEAGSKVTSKELKEILAADVENLENRDANALLRAIVAYEWSRGIPFADIKARFSTAIRSEEVRPKEVPVELKLHYSDIEQLCEQVAGIIQGAAEIAIGNEGVDYSNRMRTLSLQVETGLPAWLAPIAKMRIPALHRNRLAALWQNEPVTSNWASILDLDPLRENEGVSDNDRLEARRLLENREQREQLHRHQVNQKWASEIVPGMSVTFDEVGDDLDTAIDGTDYLVQLSEVANALGIHHDAITSAGLFTATEWIAGSLRLRLLVPEAKLEAAHVEQVRAEDALVILRTPLRPTAYEAFSEGGSKAKFVLPEVILSLLARFVAARGDAVSPDEILESLRQIRVSALDGQSWSVYVDQQTAPPPFSGEMPPLPDHEFSKAVEEENAP
jgi:replicative superfamily II helicase